VGHKTEPASEGHKKCWKYC